MAFTFKTIILPPTAAFYVLLYFALYNIIHHKTQRIFIL